MDLEQRVAILEQKMALAEQGTLLLRTSPPKRVVENMLLVADGVGWNPGDGAGVYLYASGHWVKQGAGAVATDKVWIGTSAPTAPGKWLWVEVRGDGTVKSIWVVQV